MTSASRLSRISCGNLPACFAALPVNPTVQHLVFMRYLYQFLIYCQCPGSSFRRRQTDKRRNGSILPPCLFPGLKTCFYPELFAVLGGQTPDLRGLFLRGHGGNSAALGVQQGDAIRNITGEFGAKARGMWRTETSGVFATSGTGGGSHDSDGWGTEYFQFDVSRVVPTADENRPVNQAVRYLIRARP